MQAFITSSVPLPTPPSLPIHPYSNDPAETSSCFDQLRLDAAFYHAERLPCYDSFSGFLSPPPSPYCSFEEQLGEGFADWEAAIPIYPAPRVLGARLLTGNVQVPVGLGIEHLIPSTYPEDALPSNATILPGYDIATEISTLQTPLETPELLSEYNSFFPRNVEVGSYAHLLPTPATISPAASDTSSLDEYPFYSLSGTIGTNNHIFQDDHYEDLTEKATLFGPLSSLRLIMPETSEIIRHQSSVDVFPKTNKGGNNIDAHDRHAALEESSDSVSDGSWPRDAVGTFADDLDSFDDAASQDSESKPPKMCNRTTPSRPLPPASLNITCPSHTEHHAKSRPHRCTFPNCTRSFARRFNLTIHMKTHDPNREKEYACSYPGCKKAFHRKPDLVRHRKVVHRELGLNKGKRLSKGGMCDVCGKGFGRKDALRRHVKICEQDWKLESRE